MVCTAFCAGPSLSAGQDERARLFALEEGNCTVCHRPTDAIASRVQRVQAPGLERVGARLSADYLRRFLADPHATQPGTRMPDLLAPLSEPAKAEVVEALVHFLVARGGPMVDAPEPVFPAELEEGRQLFHEVGCVQCHDPIESAWRLTYGLDELERDPSLAKQARSAGADLDDQAGVPARQRVPLGDLAAKTSASALAAFLHDPLAVRPSGRMPSLGLTESEAHDIAAYLLREQVVAGSDPTGLQAAYYEAAFEDAIPDFDALTPVRLSVSEGFELPEHRPDRFGVRFDGFVRVDVPGEYTFFTRSDDGSRLWVDGRLVVSNTGFHGMDEEQGTILLEPGVHTIRVTMFEGTGDEGLEVHWRVPGGQKANVPTELLSCRVPSLIPPAASLREPNPMLVEEGERLFGSMGCSSCHEVGIAALDERPPLAAPSLDELAGKGAGCVGEAPRAGRPLFGPGIDREAALDAVNDLDSWSSAPTPAQALDETLARFRCSACHSRRGEGGPAAARLPYFYVLGGHDLGDEGRIPPTLDETGTKLRMPWLQRVLDEGASVRPYLATRMPRFGRDNLAGLAQLFRELDRRADDTLEPEFSMEAVEHGRRVVGTRGLGCINCHDFAGHDSLGIPAVDLAQLTERLNPQWFHRLLADPGSLNLNTRMPVFWVGGKSPVEGVLDGDPDAQIDAMWSYFTLGNSMPLPDGLVVPDSAYELTPSDRPLLCGVFMRDVSPRSLLVGFPLHTHYAFDLQNARLAKTWRGRFFNARGTWEGRAGQLEGPPSEDVFDLPPGPAFARFEGDGSAWPADAPAWDTIGRRFDAERRPIFRYASGPITVEELLFPEITAGGTRMRRQFELHSPEPVNDLWFRGASGIQRVPLARTADGGYAGALEEVVEW